jgi:hypothetical protein
MSSLEGPYNLWHQSSRGLSPVPSVKSDGCLVATGVGIYLRELQLGLSIPG